MEIQYKTIFLGEKLDITGHTDAKSVAYQEWINQQYCCDEMKQAVEQRLVYYAYIVVAQHPTGYGLVRWNSDNSFVFKFCPFCGKSITYKEVARTHYVRTSEIRTVVEYIEVGDPIGS